MGSRSRGDEECPLLGMHVRLWTEVVGQLRQQEQTDLASRRRMDRDTLRPGHFSPKQLKQESVKHVRNCRVVFSS